MPFLNGWIIRALAVRLRQPQMKLQRRFLLLAFFAFFIFLIWAIYFLFQQPTPSAEEDAAIIIFLAMGLLIAVLIIIAIVIRKKTAARWSTVEALEMASIRKRERESEPETGP